MLRNFGGAQAWGLRAAYERLLKLGYGLSILGTVPLVVIPFQDTLLPPLAAWVQGRRWMRADWRQACSQRGNLGEQAITAAVICEHCLPCWGLASSAVLPAECCRLALDLLAVLCEPVSSVRLPPAET